MAFEKKEMIEYLKEFLKRESQSINDLKKFITDDFFKVLDEVLMSEGRIFVSGIGTSGTIARRMTHLLSCCSYPASFLHPSDGQHGASGAIQEGDLIILYSKGGESDEVINFAKIARHRKASVISVTESRMNTLAKNSDHVLLYKSQNNEDQEGWICYSNSLSAAAIGDALCVAIMKLRIMDWEEFGMIHPGGAVGKQLGK